MTALKTKPKKFKIPKVIKQEITILSSKNTARAFSQREELVVHIIDAKKPQGGGWCGVQEVQLSPKAKDNSAFGVHWRS